MFLCRISRQSAAASIQGFRSSAQVPSASRKVEDVTWAFRNDAVCCSPISAGRSQIHPSISTVAAQGDSVIVKRRYRNRHSAVEQITPASFSLHRVIPQPRRCLEQEPSSQRCFWTNTGRQTFGNLNELEAVLFTSGSSILATSPGALMVQTRASSTASAQKPSTIKADGATVPGKKDRPASGPPERAPEDPEPPEERPSKTQQLKKVFKQYGAVAVSFHVAISLTSLGIFYLAVSSGVDMGAILCKIGFSESVVQSKMAAGTSTFVLAYAIHKLFAPVRISITLVCVPLIVRYLRKTGLFKPPAPGP